MSFFKRITNRSPQHEPGSPRPGGQRDYIRQSPISSQNSVHVSPADTRLNSSPYHLPLEPGARPKVLLLRPEDSKDTSNTGSSLKVDTPVQTASRLSKTFQEIVHDSNALQCLLQYLDSQGVGHLLRFWHDANSFQASTLTRIHSQSAASYARSTSSITVTETESDSETGSQGQSVQCDSETSPLKASCDSSVKVKATGSEPGPVTSSPLVESSIQTQFGGCDTGQMPSSVDNSYRANQSCCSSTSDSLDQSLGNDNGQSRTNSADAHVLSRQGSTASTPAETQSPAKSDMNISPHTTSGSLLHTAHRSRQQSECSSVSEDITSSSDLVSTESNPNPVHKLTLHERLMKSIEDDAIKIYAKYISIDATKPIGIDERLRTETISKICCEDGNVDPQCFVSCQEFVLDYTEKQFYRDFLQSEYHCMHQIHVLTHSQVNLADVLYNESAIIYFMEFMEREDAMHLLQCILELDSFQQHLASQQGQYDPQQAQNDAMVIYEKYFSLQASQPLGFENDMRFEVECNICKQEGPLADCFAKPKRLVMRTIDKLYFQQYIKSDLYYKYLSDLISTVQTAQDLPPQRRKRAGSDASSEKSFGSQSTGSENISTKNTLLATDTSGFHIKKALKKIKVNMRIDKDLLNPDALWQRQHNLTLSFGRMDTLGQFISEFDQDPEIEKKKSVTFFKRRKEKEREDEKLALQIASMIVSDITSITSHDYRSDDNTTKTSTAVTSSS